jgi:hypothetical protein
MREREPVVDPKYKPGRLNIHQIFISAHREAGTAKRRDVSKSSAVRVFGGTNGGDVVTEIGVTVRVDKYKVCPEKHR